MEAQMKTAPQKEYATTDIKKVHIPEHLMTSR